MTLSTFDCIAAITAAQRRFRRRHPRRPRRPRRALPRLVGGRPGLAPHRGALVLGHDRRASGWPRRRRVPARRPAPTDDELVDAFMRRRRPAGRGAARGRPVRALLDLGRLAAGRRLRHPPPGAGGRGAPLGRGERRRRRTCCIDPAVAADSIDEFLHFSVASDDDPDDPASRRSTARCGLRATDTGDAWTLTDGARPARRRVAAGAADRRAGGRGHRRRPAAVALRARRARHLGRPRRPARPLPGDVLHRLSGARLSRAQRNCTSAATPTSTMNAAQRPRRQPSADGGADLAADDRADRDQAGDRSSRCGPRR